MSTTSPTTASPATAASTGTSTGSSMGPATGAPVLSVDGLTVRYRGRGTSTVAVDDVSLAIEPGQCLGLVGESGSGKSTIAAAVQGLLTREPGVSTSGTVTVLGQALDPSAEAGWGAVRGQQVTTVFQDPMSSLDPMMTVGRMLGLVTGDRAESLRWLEEVEIRDPESVLGSYPHQLSGGMRQRVMIALALARRPALLVADEPTTALDVSVQAEILKLLTRERSDLGCGVLFVTHDLGVARAMCQEVTVLRRGQVVEHGTADQVFDAPRADYTRRLVSSRLTLATDRSRPIGVPEPTVVASMAESSRRPVTEIEEHWQAGRLTWADFAAQADRPRRPALEMVQVMKSFATGGLGRRRRKEVLHGVDLTIGPRESVALVGESGSGKSTILRIAAGMESADDGDVVVDRNRGEGVQVVFQDAGSSLTPWMTVGALLLERLGNSPSHARLARKEKEERVRLALERVALPAEVLDRRPGQLSGGQRQRVAIARAVVVPPALLLCDEPTSALDVSVAASVLNLLNLLRHDLGLPMLFVTHDLAAARVIADRVDVISAGRIVERVPAEQLATTMTSDYGRRLLDAVLA